MAENEILDEFILPKAGPERGGVLGVGKVRDDMRVVIRKNGVYEFYVLVPGQEPERVIPTKEEREYAEGILTQRRQNAPPAEKPPAPKTADEQRMTKAQADKAEADAAAAKAPDTLTAPPTQQWIVKSDGSKTPNPNYVPPPAPEKITRPVQGGYGEVGSAVGQTESVSGAQATYDLQSRAAVVAAMNQAQADARDAARLAIQERQLSAQEALAKYNKELDKIKLEGEAQMRALTQRGQDITLRGQDVSAGVAQRGQNMDYETSLSGQSVSMANAAMPFWNAPGQIASTNSLMAGGPPVATQPGTLPFDPATFPQQAALAARGQMPSPYALPGAPAQVATTTSYQLPP